MAGQITFNAPETQKATLDNGLEIVVSRQADLPVVSARLIIKHQDVLESAAKAGRSSLTASMLDEGTSKRDALQIQRDLDRFGSNLNIGGSKQGANVSLRSLKQHLDPSFEILADVLLHPAFPQDEFDRARKQALDGLKRQKSNPGTVATQVFARLLYGADHPLGRSSSGTEEAINALSTSDLRETWETYWRPNNAAIVFVGDITLAEATALTEKYLGEWERANIPDVTLPAYTAPKSRTVYLVDRQGAPQSEIRIGSTAPDRFHKDYYTLQMTNTLLGGAFSSRLNLNLREDKGYTYGAFCMLNMARDYGYWMATAGVQSKFTKEALVEFRKEIEGMSGGIPVTTKELRAMQDNLTRGYVQNFESTGMVLGQIAPLVSLGLPLGAMQDYISHVESQNPQQVTSMAREHYKFDDAITVIVGDVSVIGDAVRSLKWGPVVVVNEDGEEIK
jgi:zinc protease